jgi:hypothetical protein
VVNAAAPLSLLVVVLSFPRPGDPPFLLETVTRAPEPH